ncbi:hypothetical protein ACYCFK_09510 [Stutzerimonas stutzeri]
MRIKPPTRDHVLTELQLQTERWLTTASLEQIRDRLRQLHPHPIDGLHSLECGTFDSNGAVRSCPRCDDFILALETVANTARPELNTLPKGEIPNASCPPLRSHVLLQLQAELEDWLSMATLAAIREHLTDLHGALPEDLPDHPCGKWHEDDQGATSCGQCDYFVHALITVANTKRDELRSL